MTGKLLFHLIVAGFQLIGIYCGICILIDQVKGGRK